MPRSIMLVLDFQVTDQFGLFHSFETLSTDVQLKPSSVEIKMLANQDEILSIKLKASY